MGVEERYRKRQEENTTNFVIPGVGSFSVDSAKKKTFYNGVERRYMSKNFDTISSDITSRVNTWIENNNTFINNAQNRFAAESPTYRSDSFKWLSAVREQGSRFNAEAKNIKSLLTTYKDYLNEDYVNEVLKALDGNLKIQADIIYNSAKDDKYWSLFENEDEYNTFVREKSYFDYYKGWDYSQLTEGQNDSRISDEQRKWLSDNKYWLLSFTSDFEENSQYKSTRYGDPVLSTGMDKDGFVYSYYSDLGYKDIDYDFINRNEEANNVITLNGIVTNDYLVGTDDNERREMTDEEISIFNYLYATEGSDTAYKYIKELTSTLNARERASKEAEWAEYARESPVAASAFSVVSSPFKVFSYVGQLEDYLSDGTIDQNAGYNKYSYINSAIRNEVSSIAEEKWGSTGSFLYNTGISMGDFLFTTGITGGKQALTLAVLGSGAAADTTIAAKDRGLSDDQAFWLGTIAGSAEVAMEKIGLDALFDTDLLNKNTVGYLIKNALAEGGEEVGTDVINTIADIVVSQDKSQWQEAVNKYMAQGKNEAEAFGLALGDKAKELGISFLGGAVSGGVIGGGGAAVSAGVNNYEAKQLYSENAQDLITEALEINPNNVYAQKLQAKIDNGKSLSGLQLNRLSKQNESAVLSNDVAAIKGATVNRLVELGETGDVEVIATALAKQVQGERLTFTEREAIKSSKFGQRVANELNVDNIKSGEYSSAWAEKIGTDRINVEEYNRLLENLENETEGAYSNEIRSALAKYEAKSKNAEEAETAYPSKADIKKATTEVSLATEEPQAVEANAQVAADTTEVDAPQTKTVAETKSAPVGEILADGENMTSENTVETEENPVTLESASKKYGAQAVAMVSTYTEGQDVAEYDAAYSAAYDMGKSGVNLSYAMNSELTQYLTESQRELAHAAGVDASSAAAKAQDTANKAKVNGKTGRKKGTVRGDGVTISDIKKAVNDKQGTAYKLLSTYAEATGIDIVLYKSSANADGKFEGAQGKFKWSENAIYIDINAGLANINDVDELAKYTMLRTFAHEFTHFIEKWNPIQYNEFRKVVFDTLTERGENVDELITAKKEQDASGEMTYDEASREVVAEAMTDILPDANFVEELATKHKTVFNKLLEKLKEFVSELKAYFNSLLNNSSREANALKEQVGESVRYVESIVKLFDKVTVEAVENYQRTVAIDETAIKPETVSKTEKVEKTTEKKTTVEEVAEIVSKNGFAVIENAEFGSLEIKFDGKPSENVRNVLKENKFRWHKVKGVWFGKADKQTIIETLDKAYETESVEETTDAEAESVVPPAEVDAAPKLSDFEKSFWNATQAERDEVVEAIDANTKISHIAPAEIRGEQSHITKQEADTNVEETGTVLSHRSDGERDTRLLAESQTKDVSRDAAERDVVDDSRKRGDEAGRPDKRTDAKRDVGGPSQRSSESADIRRDDGLTTEESTEAAEKLHEEVKEQIAQQSTEQPKGRNFVIGESLDLPNGEKSRYKANVEAIRLVKQLEAEKRYATEAEQAILSKYVGWGGLANAFDQRKAEWSKEFTELKELLSDEEYTSARGSTLNAHFTDISVIKAMYDGLSSLGFNGGRLLEPSSGVGNFVGAMPSDMTAKVKSWTMVELDGITGLIAKYLYPNADVRIQGFEKANIPDNYMDVAISNVPFGNYAITDKAYPKKVTSAIHNYFFAKSLDKVRPGGIVMFITSSYTMNSKDSTVRRYIMQRADLLGAIRLPDSAFKGNAGTEVVTDILVLKKRAANTTYAGEDFLESPWVYPVKGNYNGANINTYFENHPEMVLGTASMEGGMYRGNSLTYKAFEGKGSLADQIRKAFSHIKGKMEYPATLSREKTNFAVERANKKTKENGLVVKDGKVYQNRNGDLVEVNTAKGAAERISALLEIRDAAKDLMTYQQQGLNESEIKKARTKLNKAYDAFVKKFGYINSQANKNAIKDDPDKFSIFALENYNSETKKATKADIFSKNTIAPNRTVTSAKDVAEGLIVSVNQTGGVDTALIAKLTGKTEADVTRELIDSRLVFKNRNGDLEPAEVYLSGNVRAKLRDAEALVPLDGDYANNVEALKSVMPEDVGYQDIFVNPGTPWIPNSVYSDFAAYMLGGRNTEWRQDVDVTRNAETGNFTVELKGRYLKTNAANTQKWGTSRRSFLDLFDAMLNSKSVVIKDKLDDGSFVVNKDATSAANEKIENIQKEFQEWLWKDEARRTELATLYNETFNSVVTPKYNGDNLTVNGANANKPLRPHQRNAVQRVVSSGGNTLLAHRVGAGKTYEMAAAAMKLKELGLVKKPMFAVPKSLVAQWGVEFMDFFPTAKLLVAEASDFTAANRKVFMNRIANGEYDAVIVSYEQFEKLPISDDFARNLYQEQIDSIVAAIEEAKAEKGGKALSVKDLEKKRKSLQTKIDKLTDKAKDEDNIDFEQLGVDSLFIDEAHNFKNLFYTTSMTNVAGLGNKDGSKRAFDLYTKVRYLQQFNGGRGIVFATATPVMNSMSEMYIMQKYLQPDLLNQLGLNTFDAWAKQFGEVVNGVEIKPSGQGYRVKQSFSRFKNMSELQLLFRNFADVLTDIPGLKIPKMKGGKVNVVVCESGEFQQGFMKELEERADNIKNVDPSEDNMLKITSDGRKISYTQRMIDPSLPYEEGCKIFRCADNVIKEYNDSKSIKGTQLIFLDMATPKSKSDNSTETEDIEIDMESAQLYDDLKARLRQGGIPAKEIAFIHDADTDQKKKKLFSDVNEGKVRVLIGSTGKMGVGMNAQKRVVAIHHLDAPWRPGDVEQRDGRAFRQGNINEEVTKYAYVTEGSFDARLWDILDRKQSFINQIMNGESVGREAEDTGEVTLSAAEVKALASGSPLILEQVQLDTDIKKLESLHRAHTSAVRFAKERLSKDIGQIALFEKKIADGKADIAARKNTYSDENFSITVGKKKYTDKKEAGVALMAEATAKATLDGYNTIGSFAGFELRVIKTSEGINGLLMGKQGYPFKTYSGNTTFMITQLVGVAESIDEKVKLWQHNLSEVQKDISEQEKLIAEPFAKQAELDQKRARYNEVMAILNPKEEQSLDNVDEDKVQEQSRSYLNSNKENTNEREETRDNFYRRSNEEIREVRERGQAAYGYRAVLPEHISRSAKAFASEVQKYGIQAIVHNGLEFNKNGITKTNIGEASTVAGDVIYVKNDIDIDPIEAAGHEMFHFWKKTARRQAFTNILEENIIFSSQDFMDFQSQIAELYFGEEVGFNDDNWLKLAEEIYAYLSGIIHSGDTGNIVRPFLRDYDAVKSAWDDYIKNGTQYQQRTTTLTDREVLAMAAGALQAADLTDAERDALQIFQNRLSKLETLQDEREEQGRLYKEQQFGAKVDREAAAQTLNRMHILDDQIKTAKNDILSVEDKKVLGDVLKKARKVIEADQRAHDAEVFKRYIDRKKNTAAIKKYRERIRADATELTNWVLKPNNKDIVKHIPDVLKDSVIPFLSSIDFTSKRQLRGGEATKADNEFVKRLNGLKAALKQNIDVYGLYSGYNDLPANFMDRLQTLIDAVQEITNKNSGEFVINQMTSEELKQLSEVVRVIKAHITQFNKFHANAMFQHVYEAGDSTIDSLSLMESDNGKSGRFSNFVFWQQIRPAFAFERFGKGGAAIYDGLRRGQAQLAFNTHKIVEFTEKTYTTKEVNSWEKEIKDIKLGNDIVKMRVSDIMSFYELAKQPDSLRHMLGEGMRVATYKLNGKKISDNGHAITNDDIVTIVNTLTQRQKDVADALQKFMAEQGGAWGNYVSVARFGEEQFTNEQYFPINSDGRHLQSTADEQPSAASLYALLNMSFTKSRNEKANNRIIIYSIFDVFSNHMASMAQYNAMALPVLDAIKWFNYQQKTEDADGNRYIKNGVREQMARVYGVPEEARPGAGKQGYAETFVLNILKAFNGTEAQGIPTDATGINAIRRYNMAQVAYNFRVVVQQPLAITRAAHLIDYGSIIKGMKLRPSAIKQNIEEMQKHSGIAAWKALGFYDTNISRGLTETIKHSSTLGKKIGDIGMRGAEKADTLTWAAIWSACKEEVIKKQKLTPKSEGFFEAATTLFEDVIYKTQVVDSILTKNEFLRSKGAFARLMGSFMSEPTTTASLLIDAYDKYNTDLKRGMSRSQAWEKNRSKIGRTMYVYGVSAVILAAVQAVADGLRDDDDYETFIEKWFEAFGGNVVDELMPINKLPILADFYDLTKELVSIFGVDTYGNPPQSVFMQWYDSLVNGVEIMYDKFSGKETNYTYYGSIHKLLQAASGITGLPMASATREIVTAWNNIVGGMAPSLKVKTYEPGEKNEIKYAYADGYLTFDEAVSELLKQGLVDNEDEAYFTVQGWEAGDGYSRYDVLENAVRTGTGVDEAMGELLSHGYTEKDIYSRIRSKAGEWYKGGEISKQKATSILEQYTDMNATEITMYINEWSSFVVTGIEYEDIGDELMAGNITESRAVEMYIRYGGMTREKAAEKVAVLSFVKEHPESEGISYAAVSAYTQHCEPVGIDVGVFYDVWKYGSGVSADVDKDGEAISGSKKAKILDYIDALGLSKKQKDSLYYALGYAKSTIKEAPWR